MPYVSCIPLLCFCQKSQLIRFCKYKVVPIYIHYISTKEIIGYVFFWNLKVDVLWIFRYTFLTAIRAMKSTLERALQSPWFMFFLFNNYWCRFKHIFHRTFVDFFANFSCHGNSSFWFIVMVYRANHKFSAALLDVSFAWSNLATFPSNVCWLLC